MDFLDILTQTAPWAAAAVSFAAALRARAEGERAAQKTIAQLRKMLEDALIDIRRLRRDVEESKRAEREMSARASHLEGVCNGQSIEIGRLHGQLTVKDAQIQSIRAELETIRRDAGAGGGAARRAPMVSAVEHVDVVETSRLRAVEKE